MWAGVIAATGPVFSAGADLKLIASGGFAEMETERGGFAGLVAARAAQAPRRRGRRARARGRVRDRARVRPHRRVARRRASACRR